jgi:protein-S-isoprenylcysteine O-methyltransferase Ste14
VFVVVWLLAAFTGKKTVWRLGFMSELKYRVPTALGAILLLQSDKHPLFDMLIVPNRHFIEIIAALICMAGVIIALWARWTIGRNWSGDVTLKENHELIERGPYCFVRHPIYTGILLLMFGTAVAIGQLVSFFAVVIVAFGFILKLKQEEMLMLTEFPEQYKNYMNRVSSLVPFLY